MAYTQDISLLMRELLKVPKDYTPTAVEISKYIRSRYAPEKDIARNRLSGSRGFSSIPVRHADATVQSANPSAGPKSNPNPNRQPGHQINNRKMPMTSRKYSGAPMRPVNRVQVVRESSKMTRKKSTFPSPKQTKHAIPKSFSKRSYTQAKPAQTKNAPPRPPKTAPIGHNPRTEAKPVPTWSWQNTKTRIRGAMSEIAMQSGRTKLKSLAEQQKADPELERLQTKKKEMLRDMVSENGMLSESRSTPIRTREILQLLMEENKLEVQKREIAQLRELAKNKIMEARKALNQEHRSRKACEPFDLGA